VRKIGITLLLTSIAVAASASPSDHVCKTEYLWGLIPYEVCTFNKSSRPIAAPEIDPASTIAGLTLMAGGLAVLRGRRERIAKA
jgi:hypothetical protein